MSSVLAVFFLLASTGATTVKKFSDDVLEKSDFLKPNLPEVYAELVTLLNSRLELHKSGIINGDTVLLETDGERKSGDTATPFPHLDVIYNGAVITCGIKHIGIRVGKSKKNTKTTNMGFILFTKCSNNPKRLLIYMPVFETPSKYAKASPDDNEFKTWARTARVGVTTPFAPETLSQILQGEKKTLSFDWLEDVLQYPVRDTQIQHAAMDVWVSRPFILSECDLERIIQKIEEFLEAKTENLTDPNISASYAAFLQVISHKLP